MPEAHADAPALDAGAAIAAVVGDGGIAVLLGDGDPVEPVRHAAERAGRGFEHIDARGLRTLEFDRLICGSFEGGRWHDGALTRTLLDGGVFLLSHGEALLDDLRQRSSRMFLTRTVMLHGPRRQDDRTITGAAQCALLLHVDDHQPLLLQTEMLARRFPTRIRIDLGGPPPVARR